MDALHEAFDAHEDPRIGWYLSYLEDHSIPRTHFLHSVGLIGFPHEQGTLRNGGRGGGQRAPGVIRSHLRRIGPVLNAEGKGDLRKVFLKDYGDAQCKDYDEALKKHTELVAQVLTENDVCISFGGDNAQSYQNFCGLKESRSGSFGVVNLDAHLDVRPLVDGKRHSGSPFRLLLEDTTFQKTGSSFAEFAVQSQQCSAKHVRFVVDHGHSVYFYGSDVKASTVVPKFTELVLQPFSVAKDNLFVSFDIDCIASRDCPGVSCPAPIGLSAEDALEICYDAGKCNKVSLFDLSEFTPDIEEYRTARLVSNMIYFFLLGVSQRRTE